MKIKEAIDLFLTGQKGCVSEKTSVFYEFMLSYWSKYIGGDKELSEVTIADLRAYRAYLSELDHARKPGQKLSAYTVYGAIKAVKRFFNWLFIEEYLPSNPARRLEVNHLPDMPRKGLPESDRDKILEMARRNDPRDLAIVTFLADTGCRAGGLVNLKMSDLDLKERKAIVHEKGNKSRAVFFSDRTAKVLSEWLSLREDYVKPGVEEVFVGYGPKGTTGDPMCVHAVYELLRRLAKKAGVADNWNPHQFRHGMARGLLMRGANLSQVQQILGHASVNTTCRFYASFAESELAEAHNKFGWMANDLPPTPQTAAERDVPERDVPEPLEPEQSESTPAELQRGRILSKWRKKAKAGVQVAQARKSSIPKSMDLTR